jgi:hypothetical protein
MYGFFHPSVHADQTDTIFLGRLRAPFVCS